MPSAGYFRRISSRNLATSWIECQDTTGSRILDLKESIYLLLQLRTIERAASELMMQADVISGGRQRWHRDRPR